MGKSQIAPTLTELVEAWNSIKTVSGRNTTGVKLRRELRAMKAVARALDGILRSPVEDTIPAEAWNRAVRARDRLSRASGKGER